MHKIRIGLLLLLMLTMLSSLIGCTSVGVAPQGGEPPTNLRFEETTKGVYLRFDFDETKKYTYIYEVKIFKEDLLVEIRQLTTDLPILEFTDLLRDESLTLTFKVKGVSVDNINSVSDYSMEITYFYDIDKVHYSTAPIVSDVKIQDNYEIEWNSIEGITEYELVLNHYFQDGSKEVIKIKVKNNKFDLSKTILFNDQKLTVQIKTIGSFLVGEKYFHSSDLSDEYTVFERISEEE